MDRQTYQQLDRIETYLRKLMEIEGIQLDPYTGMPTENTEEQETNEQLPIEEEIVQDDDPDVTNERAIIEKRKKLKRKEKIE